MPSTNLNPLIYDLTMLAHGTAVAERLLVTWLEHMEVFADPHSRNPQMPYPPLHPH